MTVQSDLTDAEVLSCDADTVEELIGCRVGELGASNPSLGKIVDLLWHGESVFCAFVCLRVWVNCLSVYCEGVLADAR